MRGTDERSGALFSYVDLEARVPRQHPLRAIRELVNEALGALDGEFSALYTGFGRPSIAPEKLLRALLLQAVYSIRSERQLMERLEFDLLFRWFVGLGIDDAVWDHSVFSKNRDRLLEGDIAAKFLVSVLALPRVKRLLSSEHFSVDGTLIEAWASLTRVSGHAERLAALDMIEERADRPHPVTLAADKGFDAADFVAGLREMNVTPHIAQNTNRRSAIDRRTTRHPGYTTRQRIRKRIEEGFGWMKSVAGMRKTKFRGLRKVGWASTFSAAPYNIIRIPKLMGA